MVPLENTGMSPEITADIRPSVSEVKGMFNRCIRQDQWDWFDVWTALSKPSTSDLESMGATITDVSSALSGKHVRQVGSDPRVAIARLIERHLDERLNGFLEYLDQSYVGLKGNYGRNENQNFQTLREDRGRRRGLREIQIERIDYANKEHRRALTLMSSTLDRLGYFPERNIFVDLFARLRSGPAIFEVKSITPENELSQARHGIGQLYEYRYRHNYPQASLWLVFSR